MIELRELIQAELEKVSARVYYQVAPESATYPYIVFEIPSLTDDGEYLQYFNLEIDGWDTPSDGSTSALEILMRSINDTINKAVLSTSDRSIVLFLKTKLTLTDPDTRIKRRKYIYDGRYYERS